LKFSKSKIFIGIAISFAVGVLVGSRFYIETSAIYICLAIAAGGFTLSFMGSKKYAALFALFLFCAGLGALRLQASLANNQYTQWLGLKQKIEGYIVQDIDVRSDKQLITFRPEGFEQNILITTTLGQEFFYGDWILAEGKIAEVKNFSDFDYQKYLERYNVYAVMSYPKVLILKSHQLNPAKEFLLKIKYAFAKRVGGFIKEPQSSLLMGILIGARKTLPQNIIDNFNNTGTSHIIAVSGFNITIIISALGSLVYLFGRKTSFWLSVFALFGFVIIAGASASVIRAAIMGFLLLLSFRLGRQYAVAPALFLAALVMLIINPKILFWDVGFQLSFAATLGIVYFLPLLQKFLQRVPEFFGGKTLILTTLSAIIATLPLILLTFGRLSLSALLVNVLVLPAVPFAMLFGFLAVLPLVGQGFAFAASGLLLYILKITEIFAGLPYSSLNIKISPQIFWVLVLAVLMAYYALRRQALKLNKSEAYDNIVRN